MKHLWRSLTRKERTNKLPLFWKHMLLMMCLVLLSVVALFAINQNFLKTLSREQLSKMQMNLERDCEKLNDVMYATITIPSGIEDTRQYEYLRGHPKGPLEVKYHPVLSLLRDSLKKQVYLREDSAETLLYLSNCNSLVGTHHYAPVAENYFGQYIEFSDTDVETIMGYLRKRNSHIILPMQSIRINGEPAGQYLTLIMHPLNSSVGIMGIYSEDRIKEYLGIDQMPEGTHWEMRSADGQMLARYPKGSHSEPEGERFAISGELNSFQVSVTAWVSESYFNEMLHEARMWGVVMIVLVAVLGFLLACWLSKVSVVPIRKLISTHGLSGTPSGFNEILHLDNMLSDSREKQKVMQDQLICQILAKVFSGGVLSDSDERLLARHVPCLEGAYQVAVLRTSPQINAVIGPQLETVFKDGVWTVLSMKETGVVFRSEAGFVSALTQRVQTMNEQLPEKGICCGISAPAAAITDLHTATRQARMAVPQEKGCDQFSAGAVESHAISWQQHERLYQSIFNNDQEDALRLLNNIAAFTSRSEARSVFYNVRFVLRCAAEEIGLSSSLDFSTEYEPDLLPKENVLNLTAMLQMIFAAIHEKKQGERLDWRISVLDHMRQNLGDSGLCALSVAEHFGVTEKRIYETVRAMTGMSFREYLTDLRMKKAAELLYTTRDGIGNIAEQCGYRNSTTFYRLFQEHHGMAPGEYRKKVMQE